MSSRADKGFTRLIKVFISPAVCYFDVKMASAMWQNRKFAVLADVMSLLISVVDIKCDHPFSYLDQKERIGIKIKMELLNILFRYKTATTSGLGGREIFQLAQ